MRTNDEAAIRATHSRLEMDLCIFVFKEKQKAVETPSHFVCIFCFLFFFRGLLRHYISILLHLFYHSIYRIGLVHSTSLKGQDDEDKEKRE